MSADLRSLWQMPTVTQSKRRQYKDAFAPFEFACAEVTSYSQLITQNSFKS